MTKCYQRSFEFPRVNRRIVEARFDGGDITSDGGVLLFTVIQADRLTGLSDSIARALSDPRRQAIVAIMMCRVWFGNACMRLRWAMKT